MTKTYVKSQKGPIIYNLFPRLVGSIDNWMSHIKRAKAMGFNWIYINPFHDTGNSGSIYAIKDHYSFNPIFFPQKNSANPYVSLKRFIKTSKDLGLKIMADVVINHTSTQSHLLREHPGWYKRDENGRVINPGAMHKGRMVYWRDLAEVDNAGSKDRESLWAYWLCVIKNYLSLGFLGFRCDAAYQVPSDLWRFLIHNTKDLNPEIQFFAETLGCSVEQTLSVANAGFDYIYNSFKWWNLKDEWFLEQHRQTQTEVPSVSFPESHDTKRLADELKDNIALIKQKYLIAALLTKGLMTTIGFEFGFHNRLNVKTTKPDSWEEKRLDLTDFIKNTNKLKSSYEQFNEETALAMHPSQNSDIKIIVKSSKDGSKCILIINKHRSRDRSIEMDFGIFKNGNATDDLREKHIKDISLEGRIAHVPSCIDLKLKPGEVKVFLINHCT